MSGHRGGGAAAGLCLGLPAQPAVAPGGAVPPLPMWPLSSGAAASLPGQISTWQSQPARLSWFPGLESSDPPNGVWPRRLQQHSHVAIAKTWGARGQRGAPPSPCSVRTRLPAHSSPTNYRDGSARGVLEEGTGNLGLSATYGAGQSPSFCASPQGCESRTTPAGHYTGLGYRAAGGGQGCRRVPGTARPGPRHSPPSPPRRPSDHRDKADPTVSSLKAGCCPPLGTGSLGCHSTPPPPPAGLQGGLTGRVRSQAPLAPSHHPSSPGSEAEGGESPQCYKPLATLGLTQSELCSASPT